MKHGFRLFALMVAVATMSLQCTKENDAPTIPTTIDNYFKAGSFSIDGRTLNYQESTFQDSQPGKAALVVVLHGQYANGSNNESQLHQDAMIKIWHYLSTSGMKAVMLAPQCPTGYEWDENPDTMSRMTMSELLKAMLDKYLDKQTHIDTSRIYILGYSDAYKPAGGGGVWRMLNDYTDMFAGAMVVAADPDERRRGGAERNRENGETADDESFLLVHITPYSPRHPKSDRQLCRYVGRASRRQRHRRVFPYVRSRTSSQPGVSSAFCTAVISAMKRPPSRTTPRPESVFRTLAYPFSSPSA
jgi:hypothetical protein